MEIKSGEVSEQTFNSPNGMWWLGLEGQQWRWRKQESKYIWEVESMGNLFV